MSLVAILFFRPWMHPGIGGTSDRVGASGDDEAPKDPGARVIQHSYTEKYTEKDYEGETNTLFKKIIFNF